MVSCSVSLHSCPQACLNPEKINKNNKKYLTEKRNDVAKIQANFIILLKESKPDMSSRNI
jgi:hypothetical protein